MAASLGPAAVPIWLGVSLATLFAALSGFHFLWALGARSDLANLVPTVDGRPTFRPGRLATVAVALLLLAAAALCVDLGALHRAPTPWTRAAVWAIATLFALRAVGDLRLVGFFKRVRGTEFARRDTLLYSPLCLLIAGLAAALAATA